MKIVSYFSSPVLLLYTNKGEFHGFVKGKADGVTLGGVAESIAAGHEVSIIIGDGQQVTEEVELTAAVAVEDNEEIANMLHCTVRTIYNLRAIFKSRLAVSMERFNRIISDL